MHCKKAVTGKMGSAPTLYLINTEYDQVVAGPYKDPKYLFDIATEEVAKGIRPDSLRIVGTTHTIDIESVNLKLTEA